MDMFYELNVLPFSLKKRILQYYVRGKKKYLQ